MQKAKKALSMFLAILLVLSGMSTMQTVQAAAPTKTSGTITSDETWGAASGAGRNITLTGDLTIAAGVIVIAGTGTGGITGQLCNITVPSGKTLFIEGHLSMGVGSSNSSTLTVESGGRIVIGAHGKINIFYNFTLPPRGTVKVKSGGTIENYGTIALPSDRINFTIESGAAVRNAVILKANGGTYEGSSADRVVWQTWGTELKASDVKDAYLKSGYTHLGWSTSGSGTTTLTTLASSTNTYGTTVRYAVYKPNDYTIALNQNGATTNGTTSHNVTYDSVPATITSRPSRTGYTFNGYWTAATGGTQIFSNTGTVVANTTHTNASKWTWPAAVTLYAQWTPITSTVTLNQNGATTNGATIHSVTYGSVPAANTILPSRTGHTFNGYWTAATGGTQIFNSTGAVVAGTSYTNASGQWIGTAAVTLYAQWTPITSTVTLNRNSGAGGAASHSVTYGSVPAVITSLPSRTGYTFEGYWDSITGGTQIFSSTGAVIAGTAYTNASRQWIMASTVTLYAHWSGISTLAVSCADITYGDTPNPIISNSTGGTRKIEYKVQGAADGTYTTAVPKNAGDYTVRVTEAATATHEAGEDTANFTINKKELTITNTDINDKEYDGTTTAAFARAPALSGVISSEIVALTYGTHTFSNKNVGNAITINFTAFSISGPAAVNYTLTQPTGVTASITPKSVTINGLSAANKTYDGTAAATVTGTAVINGKIAGDDVNVIAGSAAFADKNAGTGKTVTFSGFNLNGTDATNYTLSEQPESVTADITPKSVTITGLSAIDKEYDGTTTATVTGTTEIDGKISGDDVSVVDGTAAFADKNAGAGKSVTFSGFNLNGTDAGNYTLSAQPLDVRANITPKTLNASITPQTASILEGETLPSFDISYSGFVTGENISNISGFSAPTINGKPANSQTPDIYNLTLSGGNAGGNYTFSYTGATLTVYAAAITEDDYTFSAPDGENGWYKGDTVITPKNGYDQISADGVTWEESLTVSAEGENVSCTFHLKNSSTGVVTAGETIYLNIDKTAPTQPDMSIEEINTGNFARFMNFITFGAFFKEGFKVTITASDTGSGLASITYNKGDGEVTEPTDDEISFNVTGDFKDTITTYATDKAGNNGSTVTSTGVVNEDENAVITVVNEADFSDWLTADMDMEVTVEDEKSGIHKITYTINGGAEVTLFQAEEGVEITTAKDIDILLDTNGQYNVVIAAEDNSGNTSEKTIAVKMDKATPTITATGNTADYLQSDMVTVSPAAGDSSVAKVDVQKDGGAWTDITASYGSGYTVSANGDYTFRVTNGAGVTATDTITYDKIDTVKPVVFIDSGSYTDDAWTNTDVTLSVSNTAANLGTTTFKYSTDSGANWNSYTGPITVTDETDGTEYSFMVISESGVESDMQTITVKIDKTTPEAKVQYKTNGFKQFMNTVTFGLFFKKNLNVSIQSTDTLSDVAKTEYYKADAEVTDISTITGWITGTSFNVTQNDKFILYVRVTDNAGNVTVYSDGVVVYTDSAQDDESISFTKTSTTDVTAKVTLNGNTIEKIINDTAVLVKNTDYIASADGTITFKASYLDTLAASATAYTLTVYYNPMGETYQTGDDNEAPATTTIALTVNKANVTPVVAVTPTTQSRPGNVTLSATGLPVSATGTLQFKANGTNIGSPVAVGNTVTFTASGNVDTYTFTVEYNGDGNYNSAVSAGANFTFTKGTQTGFDFAVGNPTTKTYGDTDFTVFASGGQSGSGVTYAITSGNATIDSQTGEVAITGAGSVVITATKAGDEDYNQATATLTITVSRKEIIIGSITAQNKIYDGSTTATLNMPTITTAMGLVSGDNLTISATGTFNDKNVGTGKTVTIAGFTLGGTDADNYVLASSGQQTITTASITAKPLTMNVTVSNKAYDGLNTAAISSVSLNGAVTNDAVSVSTPYPDATFASVDIANNIEINLGSNFTLTGADAHNYSLTQPSGITANITAGFTPVKDTHYTVSVPDGNDGWFKNDDFVITAKSGYILSLNNTDSGNWESALTYSDGIADGSVTFYVRDTATKEISVAKTENYKIDKTAPEVEITDGTNKWYLFLNTITFGLLFKETKTITITSTDNESGTDKIYYCKSATQLDEEAVKALTAADWTEGNSFNTLPNDKFIVYIKATDKAGNITYASSNGIIIDTTAPVISGITNDAAYCAAQTVTVTDDYLDTVKVNGTAVTMTDGKFTLSPASGTQTVVAVDKAGNTTTVTVTVNNGHTWGNWTEETAPSCTVKGSEKRICSVCGTEETRDTDALGHDWETEFTTDTPATCTVKGSKSHHCSRCDEKKDVTAIESLGHTWGNWTQTTAPTCTEKGAEKRVCSVCEAEETRDVNALGHDWETEFTTDTPATCTVKGSKSHHCSRCDEKKDVTAIESLGHTWGNWTQTTAPTCAEKGAEKRVCSVCEAEETRDVNALGHDWETEFTTDTPATCTEEGSKSHHCSRCDEKNDVTVIPAIGHNYSDWTVSKLPTAETEGERKKVCSNCGDVVTEKLEKLTTEVIGKDNDSPAMDAKTEDLSGAVDITDELAKGNKVEIYLEITDITGTVPEEDRKAVSGELKDTEIIGAYLNISLFTVITEEDGSSNELQHSDTNKLIKITVTIPEELRNMAPYTIIRIHNGEVTRLETEYDAVNHTLTFQTDKFSTYAILASEAAQAEPTPTPSEPTPTEPDEEVNLPKTGDYFPVTPVVIALLSSGALVIVSVRKKFGFRKTSK